MLRTYVGIGLTLFSQFGHATHHPFDTPDPAHALAKAMMAANSSSIAAVSPQLVGSAMACGIPVAHRVMTQYGLTPEVVTTPILTITSARFV
jgi:hypothetical protein